MAQVKDIITGQFIKQYNQYKLNLEDEHGLYGIGYCSNSSREFYFDMDDYDKIKDYCWYELFKSDMYSIPATRDLSTKKHKLIHHIIIGKYYDHIDRNPFNNRKYNLRKATPLDNSRNHSLRKDNKTGFIGVIWDKENDKWLSYIRVNNKHKNLGRFVDKNDAIKARLQAELKFFGPEFAPQRHLFKEYNIIIGDTIQN